jgi:hypothetical protein
MADNKKLEQRTKLYIRLKPVKCNVNIRQLPDITTTTDWLSLRHGRGYKVPYFGSFMRVPITFEKHNIMVYEFYPHSAETRTDHRKTYCATTAEALAAAMKFLNEKGYVANLIDLEGMIALA